MIDGPGSAEWQAGSSDRQQKPEEQLFFAGQDAPAGYGTGNPQPAPPWGYAQPGPGAPGSPMPGYGAAPMGEQPPTHMVWARIAAAGGVLFSLILGFPTAMVAIRHARKVRPYWESGDQAAARAASMRARTWAIVSTVLDVLGVVMLTVIIAASGSASGFNNPATVAASIKTQLQQRISDPGSQFYQPGLKVTSVVCTPAGARTDHCTDHFSNGQTVSETAVISANGQSYVAH